ncbi:MAG: amidohydrolase [Clostridiales bacterium]|nr:amidohydrolase [Clostridiales bacterium]
MKIVDAHAHLWKKQDGYNDKGRVFALTNGRSNFGGEIRQMMPPYMLSGENNAEMLISNMDYAGVSGAVITQEVMDGNQNDYLLSVKAAYPDKIRICSLYEEGKATNTDGFDGIKLCSCKFRDQDLSHHFDVFRLADEKGLFISIDMADGDLQTGSLKEIAQELPDLRIAVGHFGMVTRDNWTEQIKLARLKNVFIESGGITWLFNEEFYPYPSAVKAINKSADICGFDKLMWGSDYPRTMVEITYKMSFDFVLKTNEISDSDKAKFLSENAKGFYRFDNLQEPEHIAHML